MECGTLAELGGQLMHCQLTNQNVLGATITIKADTGKNHSLIIGPQLTADMSFSIFARNLEQRPSQQIRIVTRLP
jgi:hypothetical protein